MADRIRYAMRKRAIVNEVRKWPREEIDDLVELLQLLQSTAKKKYAEEEEQEDDS